ncbi:hypothetical protein JCM10207_005955 [Rhodosporidiobolus poonsookiae]
MSATDSLPLVLSRTVAVVGLGYAAGIAGGIPLWTLPALTSHPSISADSRLHIWDTVYKRGKTFMVSVLPTTSLLLAYASYAARPPLAYLPHSWVGLHRKAILGVASALTLSVVGWTVIKMEKLNHHLMDVQKSLHKGPASPAEIAAKNDTDNKILGRWNALHNVRCVVLATAFVLATTELAFA